MKLGSRSFAQSADRPRAQGILYHQLPSSTKHSILLQCVTPLPPDSSLIPPTRPTNSRNPSFLDNIFGRRSASTPPASRNDADKVELPVPPRDDYKKEYCLKFYLRIDTGQQSSCPTATASVMDGNLSPLLANYAYDAAQHLTRHSSAKGRRLVSDPSSKDGILSQNQADGHGKRSQSTPRLAKHQPHKVILVLSDSRATDYVLMALGPCHAGPSSDSDALEPYETDEHEQGPSSLEELHDAGLGNNRDRGRSRAANLQDKRSKAQSARPSRYLPTLEVPNISRESSRPAPAVRAPLSRQVSDYVAKQYASSAIHSGYDDKPYDEQLVVRIRSGLMMNR